MNWKPVKGFEEHYLISDSGQVWSLHRHRALKPEIDRYGYEKVVLCKNGKNYYFAVHRLVAIAFVDNPHSLPTVNHINENKLDNRACNLEWLSIRDNDNHGTRNKRMALSKSNKSVEQVLNGVVIQTFVGVKDASRQTKIDRCCIAKCCKNIRKTAGGYQWRYANA